jgi:hypothetical protein
MSHYTQIIARTDRPTQALGALSGLEAYMFPHTSVGTLICEKTSETIDVRILIQVARVISSNLGRGCAVLAIAGDQDSGFGCGLFEGGAPRFGHNRLTGARSFADKPATLAEVEVLCGFFGAGVSPSVVHEILTRGDYESAVARHAALAEALGLPSWSPGVGYSRIVNGNVPPEAGTPRKPPRCLEEIRPIRELYRDLASSDSLVMFQGICGRAFKFLEEDFGFRKELSQNTVDNYPQVVNNVRLIGASILRPGYKNPYILCYRGRKLTIVIEGLSFGGRTRLCLIDRNARHLDLTGLVERRDPELLDLCHLAGNQVEQIPMFAEALRKCASDVLSGDLSAISSIEERKPGFSFSSFLSPGDEDYILALYGPWSNLRTIRARTGHKARLREVSAQIQSAGRR